MEVVVHHTCASSWKLHRALRGRPGISWVPASIAHLRRSVLGVPAVFANGRLVLLDPVSPEDVEALLSGSSAGPLTAGEALQNFVAGVLYNQALLSLAVLHGSFTPIAEDRELVEVLTRARFKGRPEAAEEAAEELADGGRALFEESYEGAIKALAFGMARELYWLGLKPGDVDERFAAAWLLAKATVGRIGLQFPRPGVDKKTAADLAAVIKERGEAYLAKIEEEQKAIAADADFLFLFS